MGADDEHRVVDVPERRRFAGERIREIGAVKVVLVLELESEEPLVTGPRRREKHAPAALRAPLRLFHEEQARGTEHLELLPQVRLQPRREEAPAEDVAAPGTAVLDQNPGVDPARRRAERLAVLPGDGGAEGPALRRSLLLRALRHGGQGSLL